MDQLKINVDVFRDKNCYDTLVEICKKYNAIIHWWNGYYTIYRPYELSRSTVYGRHFTDQSTKTPVSISSDQLINRPGFESDFLSVNGGMLNIIDPFKKVTCMAIKKAG
jgi:hypothetical protein